jgi:predicted nuclease with TOPRIM domain
MTINIIIAGAGLLLSALTFVWGRITAAKNNGKESGQIMSELGYLRSNTDEIKRRLDKQDERDREYISRLTAVEESAKSAHKRLESLEKRNG